MMNKQVFLAPRRGAILIVPGFNPEIIGDVFWNPVEGSLIDE
jgi:hypothetical protein